MRPAEAVGGATQAVIRSAKSLRWPEFGSDGVLKVGQNVVQVQRAHGVEGQFPSAFLAQPAHPGIVVSFASRFQTRLTHGLGHLPRARGTVTVGGIDAQGTAFRFGADEGVDVGARRSAGGAGGQFAQPLIDLRTRRIVAVSGREVVSPALP